MRRLTTGLALMIGVMASVLTVAANNNGGNMDAPEISRSRGTEGSVVILWPRMIPGNQGAESQWLARAVQEKLVAVVREALPGRSIDVRPAPERVCPMNGCDGLAVGAVFMREQNGCAIVGLVSPSGTRSTLMVPWAGNVRLDADRVPFRQPPENWITVTDFGMCDQMSSDLRANEDRMIHAIRNMAR